MSIDKKQQMKLLSYFVLGDGGVYQYGAKEAKFIMNMIKKNEDYVLWVKEVIEQVTSTRLYEVQKEGNRQVQLRLESKQHPIFTTLRDRIYVENYKGIDPHTLKLLDAEALAILYMCDGSFIEDFRPEIGMKNPSFRVTLNMKRLSYGDLFLLKKTLKENLDLEWNINKQNKYYYLVLRTKDVSKFCEMVKPHMKESFYYKLGRFAPEKGGDIVCSVEKSTEVGGNDQSRGENHE